MFALRWYQVPKSTRLSGTCVMRVGLCIPKGFWVIYFYSLRCWWCLLICYFNCTIFVEIVLYLTEDVKLSRLHGTESFTYVIVGLLHSSLNLCFPWLDRVGFIFHFRVSLGSTRSFDKKAFAWAFKTIANAFPWEEWGNFQIWERIHWTN